METTHISDVSERRAYLCQRMHLVHCEIYHLPEKHVFYSQEGIKSEPQFLVLKHRLWFMLMNRMGGEPQVWVASSGVSTCCHCLIMPQCD